MCIYSLLAFNQLIPIYRQKGSTVTSSWYLFVSISFIIVMYFFETYLSYRQYLTYFYKNPPQVLLFCIYLNRKYLIQLKQYSQNWMKQKKKRKKMIMKKNQKKKKKKSQRDLQIALKKVIQKLNYTDKIVLDSVLQLIYSIQ